MPHGSGEWRAKIGRTKQISLILILLCFVCSSPSFESSLDADHALFEGKEYALVLIESERLVLFAGWSF